MTVVVPPLVMVVGAPDATRHVPSLPLMLNLGDWPVTVYEPAGTRRENLPSVAAVAVIGSPPPLGCSVIVPGAPSG